MRFSHKDKKDVRIIKHSTYPLDYPEKVDEAPEQLGVYIFIDSNDDLTYVGVTSTEGLQSTIKENSSMASKKGTTQYRWFTTKNIEAANEVKADWIRKYGLVQ